MRVRRQKKLMTLVFRSSGINRVRTQRKLRIKLRRKNFNLNFILNNNRITWKFNWCWLQVHLYWYFSVHACVKKATIWCKWLHIVKETWSIYPFDTVTQCSLPLYPYITLHYITLSGVVSYKDIVYRILLLAISFNTDPSLTVHIRPKLLGFQEWA